MTRRLITAFLCLTAGAAFAQTPPPAPPSTQVVVPQVERRDIRQPRLPSTDFAIGLFTGVYATENFGTSSVSGVRLGYAITEDIFVEGVYGQTTVTDEAFRQIFPGGGVLQGAKQKLTYYNLSAGWNVLTGEAFFGRNVAKASALYLTAGVGSTKFIEQQKQTYSIGLGTRLMFNDYVSVQADVRDHIFSLDLLGKRQSTQNIEVSIGLTVFF